MRHLKYECGVERKFECHICHKKFTRKDSIKTHLLIFHRMLLSNTSDSTFDTHV